MPVLSPKILTANTLISGEVVYLGREGHWVTTFRDALLIVDPVTANDVLAEAEAQTGTVVGAYLIEAAQSRDGRPVPTHFREGLRMRGPSNLFHGKQADQPL